MASHSGCPDVAPVVGVKCLGLFIVKTFFLPSAIINLVKVKSFAWLVALNKVNTKYTLQL